MKLIIPKREVYSIDKVGDLPKNLTKNSLFIIDEILKEHWLGSDFPIYFVKSGESLKDLRSFPEHMESIAKSCENMPSHDLQIVAVGGGSVGDFAGFIASTLRRGVKLIHIPTTWLSLVDSSHGGKTALNIGSYKNQIGTFYPANKTIAIKELLQMQPETLLNDAMAEMAKVSFLEGGEHFDFALKNKDLFLKTPDLIWDWVWKSIEAKYTYIDQDPFEKKGIRTELNLGHTFAHALELLIPLSHGKAVGQGLHFCLDWSLEKKYLNESDYKNAKDLLNSCGHNRIDKRISDHDWLPIAKMDKKRSASNSVRFVFLKKIGQAYVESVSFNEMLDFAKDKNWLT